METYSVTYTLMQIVGAVALLLWGTRMVKNGFTRAYATSLQQVISTNTSNRFRALLSGMGVTLILQSSTATTMICSSFASKQMIGTAAALAVVIGADIGTTLVAQVLSFDLSWLMPMLLLVGAMMHHKFEHGGRRKHLARALIGLGLILLSLTIIKEKAAPLSDSDILPIILAPLEAEPFLALLIAALMTWVLHSSLASVLLIASFAVSGVVDVQLGLLLVMGANLGGAIITYAMTFKMGTEAKRITTGNMIMRVFCIAIFLPLTAWIADHITLLGTDTTRTLINFHTLFNVTLAVLFLPFVNTIANLAERFVPKVSVQKDAKSTPLYLDESVIESPTIALAGAAQETLRMAKTVETMFSDALIALKKEDVKALKRIRLEDNHVDSLHNHIKLYLTRVNEESLDPKESDRFLQILSFSTNLEHAGDILENSTLELIEDKITKQIRFSDEGFAEIQDFHQNILANMKIAQAIFMSEDPKLARQLVEGKKAVREAAFASSERHFQRLREGVPGTLSTSALHTDLIRDFRRVNSYITTVAYGILETAEKHSSQRKHSD